MFILSHGKHYMYLKASAKSCLDYMFSRTVICLIIHTEISWWPHQSGAVPHHLNKKSKSGGSSQVQQPRVQLCSLDEADETHVSLVSQGLNWKGLRSSEQLQCRSDRDQGPDPQLKCSSWVTGLRVSQLLCQAVSEQRQQTAGEGDALMALTGGEQPPTVVTHHHLSSFLLSALSKARCWQEDIGYEAGQRSCCLHRCVRRN